MIFFSKNLKLLRKRKGWQQEELADILQVKANTISNYERGISQPDYNLLSILVKHFGVTAQQFLFEDLAEKNKEENIRKKSENQKTAEQCQLCMEKNKRINELQERIHEQSEIIHFFIKGGSSL